MAEENGRVCAVCGKALTGRQKRYCSAECREKAASIWRLENYTPVRGKQGVYREQTCIDCGKPFYGHIRSKRCSACRQERQQRLHRENSARTRAGKTRKIGSTDSCEMCGKPYIVTGGLQRYCKKCAPIAIAENIRAKARERVAEYYRDETHREEKAEARRTKVFDIKACDICGLVFVPHGNQKYCSRECSQEARERYGAKNVEAIFRACAICGKEFAVSNRKERYCSNECRKEAKRRAYRRYYDAKKKG